MATQSSDTPDTPTTPGSPGSPGMPVEFLTQRGYDPPLCTQFSVFLDNRVGRMHELMEVFGGQPIRLVAFSVVDASDHAVIRLLTTHSDGARELLKGQELAFTEASILCVELGGAKRMTQLCLALLGAELNIDYAYSLMARPHGSPAIALHSDDPVLAGQILNRKGFGLLTEAELRSSMGGTV